MFLREKRAQSTGEYAIVIGLVIAAAITVQQYVQRGLQAKVKTGMDIMRHSNSDILGDEMQWLPPDASKSHAKSSSTRTSELLEVEGIGTGDRETAGMSRALSSQNVRYKTDYDDPDYAVSESDLDLDADVTVFDQTDSDFEDDVDILQQ